MQAPEERRTKQDLRRMLRERLADIAPEDRLALGAAAADRVVATPEWQRAGLVMLYLALPDELPTAPLIEHAWREGKLLVVPKVIDARQRRMTCVRLDSLEGLAQADYGVPVPPAGPPVPAAALDFVVVPGLGFSRRGERLGRGLGYFDRFLADPDLRATTCGIAFDVQVLEALPSDAMDRPVRLLATDRELLRFGPPSP